MSSGGTQFIKEINGHHAHLIYEKTAKVFFDEETSADVHAEVVEKVLRAKNFEKLSSDERLLAKEIKKLTNQSIKTRLMKSTVAFALLVIFLFSFSSCVPKAEVEKIKKQYYDKGHRDGVEEGKAISTEAAAKEAQAVGEKIGFDKGLQKGRLEAFIEIYIEGVRRIYPKALLMGTYMFVVFFTYQLLWFLFVEQLMKRLSIQWTDFRWSVLQRFGTIRNLKIKKKRWERTCFNVDVKSEIATSVIQRHNQQITTYKGYIENGLPVSQERDANAKILELEGKNKALDNVITNGKKHKEKLQEIMNGIDMVIYSVENGETVDIDNLKMDFEDIQYDIESYLKYDTSDLTNEMDQDYRFYPELEEVEN